MSWSWRRSCWWYICRRVSTHHTGGCIFVAEGDGEVEVGEAGFLEPELPQTIIPVGRAGGEEGRAFGTPDAVVAREDEGREGGDCECGGWFTGDEQRLVQGAGDARR